ncbi:MAG: membrane protein insertase YidC [Corynebacterium sp.]|uniref:membrane protein insertase YidC n=1 Tax=Corynebacterium sp. TaxID=1720 RepID=UPI0026E108E4|nr:membrane protein insertase YidC [Corynebacterium sp.]MDO5669265.1 membrane protein insertase YidC [Corynebacterium sp.]
MLEPFIYPVSGILKLWHLLLHSVFGMNDSTAWLVSMFCLVLTVRSFLIPFFWAMAKSARITVVMRPALAALKEEYAEKTDRESYLEYERKEKELKESHGHSVAAGCVPALIQIPVFLGLYQVLLRMARPQGGLEGVAPDTRIGFLNADEINAFLDATVGGVPLPAYIAMPVDALTRLGTTSEAVRDFIMPFLIAAIVFTTVNMLVSVWRNYQTIDWESALARKLNGFLIGMVVFVPILLLSLALTGPLPVAIILYWFANNLWTLVQTLILYPLVHHKYPLSEDFRDFSNARRDAVKEKIRAKRRRKWSIRGRKAKGALMPWKIPAIRAELKEEQEAREAELAEKRAAAKALAKEKQKVRAEVQSERTKEKIARFEQRPTVKKIAAFTAKRKARKQAKSSNPPAEPTASDAPDPEQSAKE